MNLVLQRIRCIRNSHCQLSQVASNQSSPVDAGEQGLLGKMGELLNLMNANTKYIKSEMDTNEVKWIRKLL